MPYFLFLTFSLFVFWLLLSGYWDNTLLLTLGILSSVFGAYIGLRIKKQTALEIDLGVFLRFPKYIIWLFGQIWLANVDTAKRIWLPDKYPITPTIRALKMTQSTDLAQTLYANSITITPGTVSMDIKNNHVIVHALSKTSMDALEQGLMDRNVTALESAR